MNKDYLVILLKKLVVLPNQEVKIEIISDISKKIINKNTTNEILVVAPINQKESEPNIDDLPKIGVVASIKSSIELSNGNLRVILTGLNRVIIDSYYSLKEDEDILSASTSLLDIPKYNETEEKAVKRKLKTSLKKYVKNNSMLSNTIVSNIEDEDDLDKLSDMITTFLPFNVDKKLEYMQMINPILRSKALIMDLEEELHVLKINKTIEDNIKEKLLVKDKEYYLKEKLKEIQLELGETNLKDIEIQNYIEKLDSLKLNSNTYKKLINEINKYKRSVNESPEAAVLKNYIEIVLNMPWNKKTKDNLDSNKIKETLDLTHFGLDEIKGRIIDYVEIKSISKNTKNPIICLVGPPGVGKTTIAKSIADALNKKFVKISVGGLNDSIELIGSRRTYLGSAPGKIISGIIKAEVNNPLILIDEIDKMVKDYKSDPASTLLEILDQSQNSMFIDNYIEEPFDLSNSLFILTANDESCIPYALKDRLEIINLSSYTVYEKTSIANNYLLPQIFQEYNVKDNSSNIKSEYITEIINSYTKEAGVRELSRILHKLIRKLIINKENKLNLNIIKKYLGEYKYTNNLISTDEQIGISNALAYTNVGGLITQVEVVKFKGSGEFLVTGQVGDVMNESIKVALSHLKVSYKVDFKNNDIHIHFLDASTKKDGPSAGLAILVALASLSLGKKVENNIAFSGEVDLNGNILKIGGFKEKVIAAINNKMALIYLPFDNANDILEVPEKYLREINIKFVSNFKEVYEDILS